jgi:hypothetical protein
MAQTQAANWLESFHPKLIISADWIFPILIATLNF